MGPQERKAKENFMYMGVNNARKLICPSESHAGAATPSFVFVRGRVERYVAIPSFFDILATGLCSMGFLYIPASVWQLLRGAEMVFAAIFAVTAGWRWCIPLTMAPRRSRAVACASAAAAQPPSLVAGRSRCST